MKALVKCFSEFFETFRRLFQNAEFLAKKRFDALFSASLCKHVTVTDTTGGLSNNERNYYYRYNYLYI
jgi:hypothetical protein